jgi:ribosomal protein S18 acetylase RimI-like enzyme
MTSAEPPSGPRRARFPQDVPQIAQLVELGFAEVLDYASRKALRDVRQIAEMGVAAWSLARIFGGIQPDEWVLGSVWEEEGRVVGNVTLTRRTPERGAWLISNVAVHPNFRRRGIARRLARHAVDVIRAEGGRVIYLQVDVANESALRMYRELGFAEIGGRVAWIRAREEKKPPPPEESAADPCRVSLRTSSEWAEEFALYRDVSPDGTAWNTPLLESAFRPSVWKSVGGWLTGGLEKHYLARCGGRLDAVLSAYSRFSGWEGALIQRGGTGGKVERALLEAAWKVFPPDRGVLLETTAEASVDVLAKLGFQKRRTFLWMRYTIPGGVP